MIKYTNLVDGVTALSPEKIDRSEAILRKKRNTRRGLRIRNSILKFLNGETKAVTTKTVANGIGSSYQVAHYHLSNMLAEKVVEKVSSVDKKNRWRITGLGQQTIRKWMEQSDEL